MFETVVRSTPFSDSISNSYFANKLQNYSAEYKGDNSLISTLRALLANRIGEEVMTVKVDVLNSRYENYVKEAVKNRVYDRMFYVFVVHDNGGCSIDDSLAVLNRDFDGYSGFHRLKEVTDLFSKNFKCSCFVNPESKSTTLVVEELNLRQWHYMQCALLGFFPWLHKKGDAVSDIEKELIYSLREKTADKYFDVLARMAAEFNFAEQRIRSLLGSFETRSLSERISYMQREINDKMEDVKSYEESIALRRQEIYELNIQLFGYETKKEEITEGELMKFFLERKDIDLLACSGNEVTFSVRGEFTNWDEDAVESYIRNHHSCMYSGFRSGEADNVEKLMRAIFIDRKIKIRICGAYRFRSNGGAQGLSGDVYPAVYNDYMPNPHIYNYSCIGDEYRKMINDFVIAGRYVDAVTVCLMSVQCVNMNEAPTTGRWFPYMATNRNSIKCYGLPTGEFVTLDEAMKWAVENEEKEENENG